MKRLRPISMLIFGCFCLISCEEKRTTPQEEAAPSLYSGMVNLLSDYTDSVRQARDSATIDRLLVKLNDELTRVNFGLPANTDWSLSEDENDTISQLTSKLISVKMEKLVKMSEDSVAADSLTLLKEAVTDVKQNPASPKK